MIIKKILLLFMILIPTIIFAGEAIKIKDNHYRSVWVLEILNEKSGADARRLFENQKNPFNMYFIIENKRFFGDMLIDSLNRNKSSMDSGEKYLPYETLFFVKYLTAVALAGENSPQGKWCKEHKQEKFCKIFKEFQKEQAEGLDMYYGVYKALAKFYGEPFDVDINDIKNSIITGKQLATDKKFLQYSTTPSD